MTAKPLQTCSIGLPFVLHGHRAGEAEGLSNARCRVALTGARHKAVWGLFAREEA